MSKATGSFDRLNYLVRPSKQVERRLFLEAFSKLAALGYPIPEYRYVGLGSVYYADFTLFHKYLYIDRMLCVEVKPIPRRMQFNKPFAFVQVTMGPASSVPNRLARKRRHIVWLDFDSAITVDAAETIDGFLQVLAPGSVVMATVSADPRVCEQETIPDPEQERKLLDHYSQFNDLLEDPVKPADISRTELPGLVARILRSQIQLSLVGRPEIGYQQLFNYRYADGMQMVTVGGLLESASGSRLSTEFLAEDFVNTTADPLGISVPPLTVKERQYIDGHIRKSALVGRLPFELEGTLLKNYIKWYRRYPSYFEAMM